MTEPALPTLYLASTSSYRRQLLASDDEVKPTTKPAEKPSKAKIKTRRSNKALKLWAHVGLFEEVLFMPVRDVMHLSLLLPHVPTL